MAFLFCLSALNALAALGLFLATTEIGLRPELAHVIALFCFAINVTYLNRKIYSRLYGPMRKPPRRHSADELN